MVVSSGNALHVGSKSCVYEITELNFLSVGSQLPPRTLNILIDCKIFLLLLVSSQFEVFDEIFECGAVDTESCQDPTELVYSVCRKN